MNGNKISNKCVFSSCLNESTDAAEENNLKLSMLIILKQFILWIKPDNADNHSG